jgi:predicted RND superfamily exporter protein
MQFKIGPDLGLVLAKGVIFSLISVLFLLPVLAVYTYKLIDKTHHRSLIPSFHTIGKGIIKLRFGIIIIILLILIPSFIASHNNTYLYGSTGVNSETSKVYKDTVSINKEFGVNNQMVLLVPDHDLEKEASLVSDLESIKQIKEVTSFISIFGTKLPIQYLPPDITSKFISEKYSRIIITTNLPEEGKKTFSLIEKVKHLTSKYYNDRYHLAGVSVTNYDMKEIVTKDNLIVNIVAIISIILILILTFKAFIIPIILIMSIEMAIWINLSIVYLMGHSLNYIGYLIISTVQLGATVDYAILFAKKYLEKRKSITKKDAVIATIEDTAPSILSSALILGISGLSLGFISSNGVISELGSLVGRGALISALMVLLFTSSLFMLLDKYIFKKSKEEDIEKQIIE